MRIVTSNVNGVRAAHRKGFIEWIERTDPDVLLLQETRAPEDIIEEIIGKSYQVFSSVSTLKGRAGVAIAVKNAYSATFETDLLGNMEDQKDVDTGRWLEVYLHDYDLRIVSAYLHAGNEKMEEKMTAKYQHLTKVDARLKELRGTSLIMGGDFNVVRSEYDIKNWKNNHNKTAGVLDEEIVYLERWFTEYE
ncbi:MAG: endonuclease/exonuclease/phosphatase family protein, partial [Actinomycetaceae bacterium]|nr:endonuclease/exonuclease/phosphatase family protein [Actinomycetaceae bacterium]